MSNYQQIEQMSTWVMAGASLFSIVCLWFIAKSMWQLIRKKRTFQAGGRQGFKRVFFALIAVGVLILSLYGIPFVFLQAITWEDLLLSHLPRTLGAFTAIFAAIVLFTLHMLITQFFPKQEDREYFSVLTLSVLSGAAYAFVMFIVNTSLESETISKLGAGFYFVLGLALYILAQRFVRMQLTTLTNRLIFQKRVEVIDKLMKTPYFKMERLGSEKIYTTLNNDTETVSSAVGMIVIGLTSSVTMITCFIYLAISSIYVLLASVILFGIAGTLIVLVNKSADRLFHEARDTQNTFFSFIHHLVSGFKELYLHNIRRREFREDIVESCEQYRVKRTEAELVAANVYFVGELVAFIVLGGLVFAVPLLIAGISNATLGDYVLIFLFLKGPLDNVINMVPRLTQVKVSWQRINEISEQISVLESSLLQEEVAVARDVCLEFRDVEYRYKNTENEYFAVGPISYEFRSGEIIFITGGNGSGKSTLAKLLTGLYTPDKGEVLVNHKPIRAEHVGQYFSTVFSDFYLFEKLYGIAHREAEPTIQAYLYKLGLADKLQITDGVFSTTRLSTGQKKRLALLIAYLDDRPIYLFDEWAADQDPEFREHFYVDLLPQMKAQGKCVIAITHDDRYFGLADKVIKMESGHIVSEPVAVGVSMHDKN